MVFIRWSLPIFLCVVFSPAFAQQTSGELNELSESLERQDARIQFGKCQDARIQPRRRLESKNPPKIFHTAVNFFSDSPRDPANDP